MNALVKIVTEVVRDADRAFEQSGGSSRHWVREQFLPRLDDAGLVIVQQADLDAANARAEAAEAALRDERAVTRYLLRTTRDERGHYLTTDGMKKHEAAAREAVKL